MCVCIFTLFSVLRRCLRAELVKERERTKETQSLSLSVCVCCAAYACVVNKEAQHGAKSFEKTEEFEEEEEAIPSHASLFPHFFF